MDEFIEPDMGNPVSIDGAVAKINSGSSQPVDLLINNAGVAAPQPAQTVMRVNILGLKRLTERLLPTMQAGGAVVNTASTAGNRWPERLAEIDALLGIDSWDEGVVGVADHADVVADGYSFSKECLQVYTMRAANSALDRSGCS